MRLLVFIPFYRSNYCLDIQCIPNKCTNLIENKNKTKIREKKLININKTKNNLKLIKWCLQYIENNRRPNSEP